MLQVDDHLGSCLTIPSVFSLPPLSLQHTGVTPVTYWSAKLEPWTPHAYKGKQTRMQGRLHFLVKTGQEGKSHLQDPTYLDRYHCGFQQTFLRGPQLLHGPAPPLHMLVKLWLPVHNVQLISTIIRST